MTAGAPAPVAGPVTARGRRRPAWVASALLLAGPTALAAWLVFPGLGRAPLWRDEVATVSVAGRDLLGTMRVLWHREANMGLYYLVMNGWLRAGGGEIWVRLPSAVFAVATVPVTMLLARRAFGARAALAAGTVLASNSFLLTYAREARSYSLVALLAATSTLLLVRALDQPSRWRWICYVAASAAMVYSHMLAALVVVAQMASLPAARRGRVPWRTVLRSLFALAVLVLPLTAYAVLRDTGQTSWVPRPTPATLWRLGISYAGSPLLLLLEAALAALAVGGPRGPRSPAVAAGWCGCTASRCSGCCSRRRSCTWCPSASRCSSTGTSSRSCRRSRSSSRRAYARCTGPS